MGTESVEGKLKSLGKGDQVGAKTAFHGEAGVLANGFWRPIRIAQAVKRGYTQSRPPRKSRHKSIRIQEPIRFAEMRGYTSLDAAEWKCFALESLIGRVGGL